MRPARRLLACALALTGCTLDFEQFRIKPRFDAAPDVAPQADAGVDAAEDAAPDAPVAEDVAADEAAAEDALVACSPGRAPEARVRLAHMAAGLGPADLCMRRRVTTGSAPFQPVAAATWPAGGLEYAEVSVPVPLNSAVAATNDTWEFAVVARGAQCDRVGSGVDALAQRSTQLNPGETRLLLLTADRAVDGRVAGVLDVLSDSACTDCPPGQVDVRGVHAALGGGSQRMNFTMEVPPEYARFLPQDSIMMGVFSSLLGYGNESPYACNALWGHFASASPVSDMVLVRFVVTAGAAGTPVARSSPHRLKPSLLGMSRTATVFFEGGYGPEGLTPPTEPGFVVCYDGVASSEPTLTACDRVAAQLVPPDAGADAAADAWPADDVPVDPPNDAATDAATDVAGDDAEADASAGDVGDALDATAEDSLAPLDAPPCSGVDA